jgi:hypothetical protein
MTSWRMRIAYWITRAINTHSEYVIPVAFLSKQWLHELASILRRTCFARLVGVSSVRTELIVQPEVRPERQQGIQSRT